MLPVIFIKNAFINIIIITCVCGQYPQNTSAPQNSAIIFFEETTASNILKSTFNPENNFTVDLESRFGTSRKRTNSKECLLDLTDSSYEKYFPVPIYKDALDTYQEIVPQKGIVRLDVGKEIKLICAGPRNKLDIAPRSTIHSPTCVRDTTLKLGNKNQVISNFKCSHIVKGEVKSTHLDCANGQGKYFEIGHKITSQDFIKLIGVCYDDVRQTPLYAEHTLHGMEVQYASKSTYRPGFSTEGLKTNSKFNPQAAYKIQSQQEVFQKEYGSNIVTNSMFLARGHLAPNSDFILATSQFSTFFYLNVAPMWQSVNNRNWKILENTIRTFSRTFKNLKIATGTHDQFTLKDINNNEVPIYLSNQIIPVPKYFWKVVLDPDTQRAVVFVVVNNPFLEKQPSTREICEDICASIGWDHPQWKNNDSGYLFCCEFKEFKSVVSTVPEFKVKGVLRGSR